MRGLEAILPLEQLFRSRPVRLDAGDVRFDARYFGLQRVDARTQFLDGDRVEVLLGKFYQRVAGLVREEIVEVHSRKSLTRGAPLSINAAVSAAVPSIMRAVQAPEPGGPDALKLIGVPTPQPGDGEVLVRVAAAGVNRPDVLQREGKYAPPPGAPATLGLEIAGTVVAAGERAGALVGQQVCALVAGGGYAEYCVAPAGTCLPIPASLTPVEAAAMPETLFTVWVNLFERGFAADGDSVLVHGGTSGIGTMAIALGQLFNLTLIVTCGSDEKCARALELGAQAAINYRTHDFVDEVKRLTQDRGVDVVLDMVGGDYVPRNLACLAEDGRHISIAVQRGGEATIPIWQVMRRRLTLTGSTLRPRSVQFKTMVADEIARTVWPFVEGGRLKPVIDSVFPLDQVADAHRRIDAGDHVGKIVLTID